MTRRLRDELFARGLSPTLMIIFAVLTVAALGLAFISLPAGPAQVIRATVTKVAVGNGGRAGASSAVWIDFNGRPLAIKVPFDHDCFTGEVAEFYVFKDLLGRSVVTASPESCRAWHTLL